MNIKIFFLIIIATIVISRLFLWFLPKHGPVVAGLQLHHYMYGLMLILAYVFIQKPILFALGSGLVIDEIPLFFIYKTWDWPFDHWQQYFSWQSITGIVITLAICFLLTNFLWLPVGITK